ncbi:MAG: type III-B CRISPR module RAMP protein Cmr6 [Prevotella sp.]|nr:type III-B CRISPR module RAMP protein Cmr6 [Prevotella sp.]
MSKNLHKYYYKDYFGGELDWKVIKSEKNERILQKRNDFLTNTGLLYRIEKPVETNDTFDLEILYPGLVTGIGINHEATIKGEFKLGVHFDWTYGMPVIYGSSVKGVLRSYFREFYKPNESQPSVNDAFEDIFEGGKKSIYDRDIFFDAVIVQADKNGHILASDSITPHDSPLKNPVPITFLKIAPGCVVEFRYKLVDTNINGKILSVENKRAIFKKILMTVGIGAKTNVGYGQLKLLQNNVSPNIQKEEDTEYTGKLILIKGLGYKVRIEDSKLGNTQYDLKFKNQSDKFKINKKTERVKIAVTKKNNKVIMVTFIDSI